VSHALGRHRLAALTCALAAYGGLIAWYVELGADTATFRDHETEQLEAVTGVFDRLGDRDVLVPLAAAASLAYALRRRVAQAIVVGASFAGAALATLGTKAALGLALDDSMVYGQLAAYPSGHVAGFAALGGALLVVEWPRRQVTARVILAGIVGVGAGAMTASRVLGGAHSIPESVGGLALAAACVLVSATAVEQLAPRTDGPPADA
jgi:membrane-associated phospholipid phosphatase